MLQCVQPRFSRLRCTFVARARHRDVAAQAPIARFFDAQARAARLRAFPFPVLIFPPRIFEFVGLFAVPLVTFVVASRIARLRVSAVPTDAVVARAVVEPFLLARTFAFLVSRCLAIPFHTSDDQPSRHLPTCLVHSDFP